MPPNPSCAETVRAVLSSLEPAIAGMHDPEQRAGLRLATARLRFRIGETDRAHRDLAGAISDAELADRSGSSPLLWPAVVDALQFAGDSVGARRQLDSRLGEAWKVRDPEDRRNRVLLLLEMAGVMGRTDQLSAGMAKGKARDPKGFAREDAREILAGAWLAAGDLTRVTALVETLPKPRRALLLAHVATQEARRGDRGRAAATMRTAFACLEAEPDPQSRALNLAVVLRQWVRQGATAAALRRAGKSPGLRRAVAEALFETGKWREGLALNVPPRPDSVYALAALGERERAGETLAKVIEQHAYFMQDDVVRMVAAIAAADAKAGDQRAYEDHVIEGKRLAETRDPVFGDHRASLLLGFSEALLTGGWRPSSRR